MTIISIIIPCYNEEATIYELLQRVSKQTLDDLNVEREVLVVDDGSTDRSLEQMEKYQADHPQQPLKIISYRPNRGKGYAIRRALEVAKGDIFLIQDADLEYDPMDYPQLLKPILVGLTHVVYGSRWLAPDIQSSGNLYALGGLLENLFLHLLYRTNISDIATGYKVFRSEILRDLNLDCTGFEFCPEVTAKLLNRRANIFEVPIRYEPRKKKEGKKIRWTDFFVAIYTILRVKLKRL